MAGVSLRGVTKTFPGGVVAVDHVDLEIEDGEFMVLVGPSGCGKSTLLRMLAGLEAVTEGTITIGERDVTRLRAKERDVAMVFQNYALYPHMSVADNIGFGLRLRGESRDLIRQRVDEVAEVLGLKPLLKRKPAALSGGQRQRVAIGRAMVREPRVFLMDEPLSNLDAKLRVQMRSELARLRDRLQTTTVYVTHDQVEAMTLGDRVAVLRDGVLQQVDRSQTLFRAPANLFVAAFIGSPAMNLVRAVVDEGAIRFADVSIPAPQWLNVPRGDLIIGIRPTSFADGITEPAAPAIDAVVEVVEELGDVMNLMFSLDAPAVTTAETLAAIDAESADDAAILSSQAGRAKFVATLPASDALRPGDSVSLVVDPRTFYFFDTEGRALRAPHVEALTAA